MQLDVDDDYGDDNDDDEDDDDDDVDDDDNNLVGARQMQGCCSWGFDDQDVDVDDNLDDDGGDDDDGYPANPHHDKIPPWGEFVINGHGGILSSAYSHH